MNTNGSDTKETAAGTTCTAFLGVQRIASGELPQVALAAKRAVEADPLAALLAFRDSTAERIELDLRGTDEEFFGRYAPALGPSDESTEEKPVRPGRPKLGVVAREITLLPRHWDWLTRQPGGASVALRKLVEEARRASAGKDRIRQSQEATYRFLSAIAGNLPGFEEVTRALFAGDGARFDMLTAEWPTDIREYAQKLATAALERGEDRMNTQQEWKTLIPAAKHNVVEKAILSTFGSTQIEDITPLSGGGSSALLFKFVVDTRPYVMRVMQDIHALNDPVRQFACQNIAADAGISPRVHYADAADALSITDFIASVPFGEYPGSLLVGLAETIKAIHATPAFPALINYLDGIDGFIETVRAMGILPEQATREHFRYYARLQEVYPRHDPDRVSSHNDLNPRNILFDGNRLWVIDWETAFRNDRYADLANVANFFFREESAAEEDTLLGAYFGETLDEYRRARFFLMRPVCQMFYALVLMLSVAQGRTLARTDATEMETPRLREFHQRFTDPSAAGDPLASAEGLLLYGKVWLNEALHTMKTPRFDDAIARMKSKHR